MMIMWRLMPEVLSELSATYDPTTSLNLTRVPLLPYPVPLAALIKPALAIVMLRLLWVLLYVISLLVPVTWLVMYVTSSSNS